MRLIHCETLLLEEFIGSNIPEYAILSHTWEADEVSFAVFNTEKESVRQKAGFKKIESTCRQAVADGLKYAWVDTICIDKSSSTELSEAINSMFKWYQKAKVCYAYLSDVTADGFAEGFPHSRWFTRGWTLQELIAPNNVMFYDAAWKTLGDKREHASLIKAITQVDEDVLAPASRRRKRFLSRQNPLPKYSVAKRMAWASNRQTTRIEDMAYCLLGIFNVNMPLLYGEGYKAFIRLQEEIIKTVDDASILAWGFQTTAEEQDMVGFMNSEMRQSPYPIFASSPKGFIDCNTLNQMDSLSAYAMTNLGLEIELPLIRLDQLGQGPHTYGSFYVGLLTCTTSKASGLLGILLMKNPGSETMYRLVLESGDGGEEMMTFLVGPRLAVHAKRSRIVISSSPRQGLPPPRHGHYHKILVNLSRELAPFKYYVYGVVSSHILPKMSFTDWKNGSEAATWDSIASVITVRDREPDRSLVEITLQSSDDADQQGQISVLLANDIAVVVQIPLSSIKRRRKVYDEMCNRGSESFDRMQHFVISDSHERQWIFLAQLGEPKQVHHWKIRTLDVHVVDVTGLSENKWADERRRRAAQLTQAQ